jgi:hypothetical protein
LANTVTIRTRLWPAGSVTLLLLVVVVAAACSSDPQVITTPDSSSAQPVSTSTPLASATSSQRTLVTEAPASTPVLTAPATSRPPAPATIGSTITLRGSTGPVATTVTAIADPAPPSQFFAPDPGTRWVSVQLRLVNVGDQGYRDSPSNGAKLIDAARQQHAATFAITAVGPDLGSPTIAPGDTRLGWVTFSVPEGVVVERFTLSLDSGFADQTGEWLLTSGAPHDPAPPVLVPESGPGASITLAGIDGERVEVTLAAVTDPAPPGQFSEPRAGHRFAAVQVRLANVGDVVYGDSPSNGMTVIDAAGRQWSPTLVDSGAGPAFEGGSVTLAAGDERLGWVTFEVAADAPLVKITMALSSGFADQVGEWRLA